MRQISSIQLACGTILAAMLSAATAEAGSCPRVLDRATRLAVVTAPTMQSATAALRLYERAAPNVGWAAQGPPRSAVVGARGLAWGHPFAEHAQAGEPLKQEGDVRTPMGVYPLGATFGFTKNKRPNHLHLTPGANFCVHDTNSPLYGRIVPASTAGRKVSGEDMSKVPAYRHGIVIDYPPDRAKKGGSCIFVHVWEPQGTGTAGCVTLPEDEVVALQEWTRGRQAAIAIVTEDVAARFGDCLPLARSVSGAGGARQ
jgi:L,D-peptidoglycan transpeptidase YkuD (ErfK/YbiS/YcfS/YnhG family)